ncbi:hypothetical protein BLA39750_00975 [Burkholderia lata]|uniref:Uncharacterized protein n=1 Tax=Burkholderia lata (strain ATCC 17760 / DSM 23089 / LMG 22485 / NCIMB 9086 / R18194 / 383) TaxID=482957 RepID=A0A6P2V2P9_BURL3|nr:hypothetical protein [Burkholderia lata]VWC77426.1 hypothetical protein BLA39750_00975 [Burkholderia lata]
MNVVARIAWLHLTLMLAGMVLCAFGREVAGALVLCVGVMSLMVVKAGELIAPEVCDEFDNLMAELANEREIVSVMYRRAMTLHSYLDDQGRTLGGVAPKLAEILSRMDSLEPSVDAAIIELRDLEMGSASA